MRVEPCQMRSVESGEAVTYDCVFGRKSTCEIMSRCRSPSASSWPCSCGANLLCDNSSCSGCDLVVSCSMTYERNSSHVTCATDRAVRGAERRCGECWCRECWRA